MDAEGFRRTSLAARLDELMRQARLDRKEALKLAARERGLTRRAAYDQMLSSRSSASPEADSPQPDPDETPPPSPHQAKIN